MSPAPRKPAPSEEDLPLELPGEPIPEALWDPVDDTGEDDVAIALDKPSGDFEAWTSTSDLAAGDLDLKKDEAEENGDPWAALDGDTPPLLGEVAAPAPVLPEPGGVRALLTGQEPGRLPSPRTTLPWRGHFTAEELGDSIVYTVSLGSSRSELAVVSWQWTNDEQEARGLTIRLSDDGEDITLTSTQPEEPVVSLRGFLAEKELRFDVLVLSERERRGLLLGRAVLAEGFVVDPATDATETD